VSQRFSSGSCPECERLLRRKWMYEERKREGLPSSQYTYDLFPIAPSLRSFSHCGAHVPIIYADMYFAKVPSLQTLMNL